MLERYIIGTKPIPWWCKKRLMPYQRYDGTAGVEFYGYYKTYQLKCGDVLVWDGFKVRVEGR